MGRLVIVNDLDLEGIAIPPPEANPVPIVYAQTPWPGSVAFELL
jgi:hypothetical protein